jgi:CRISPR-associated endonuclease Cas1
MHEHPSVRPPEVTPDGVLFLRGYAASLRVNRGHLVARCGAGPDAPEARFARGSRKRIRRVVILGRGGYATWEALCWLKGVGASLLCLDASGEPLAWSGHPGPDQPALRRAQALGEENGTSTKVARYLLGLKLRDQASVLTDFLPEARAELEIIQRAIDRLELAADLRGILASEARAATAYWRSWQSLPVSFSQADHQSLPEHWLTVGERHSPLSSGPRVAVSPAQAALNFLYALAEFECRVALLAVGLDPGLGWFHKDSPYRDSAALDLIEAIRPDVDRLLANLLQTRTFTRQEFQELPSGQVRVASPLAQLLTISSLSHLGAAVAAPAESVARLVASRTHGVVVRTRLTQADRKRGRASARSKGPSRLPSACRLCGLLLDNPYRAICDDCLPNYGREQTEKLASAGKAVLAQMRASFDDPARTPEASAKQREKARAESAAAAKWDREHGRGDPAVYERTVLPRIQTLTVPQLVKLTGLSQYHCWMVREGRRRLHARHWKAVTND